MNRSRILILTFTLLLCAGGAAGQLTGKRPVIIIPGVSGSQLINPKTGKTVWFSVKRDKDDDLRLPMTSPVLSRNRDSLQVKDIIRTVELPVLPDVEVYQTLIDALKAKGYAEGDWNKPQSADVFYIFAYDWRRDNVESAHLLMRRMATAKTALKRPDLKFDILAHSMGGLVARYASMYGMSELPGRRPVPNWSGAAHINKLLMFGTPNEGSFASFDAILNGYPIVADRKLPLIDDLRAEDVLTSPSVFQLIPHLSSARFLDENLKPLRIDIYSIDTWLKYGWGAMSDPKFLGKLKDAPRLAIRNKDIKPVALAKDANEDDKIFARTTYAQVRAYVTAALDRARRFHFALDAPVQTSPVPMYAYGGNCEQTLDAVVLIRDKKRDKWTTIVEPREIKTSGGTQIKKEDVRTAMFGIGDGRVTKRSLLAETPLSKPAVKTIFPVVSSFFTCGSHTKLFLEKPIQDSFLSALVVENQKQP
ncbi:MAG: esterase/lipase family protein [Pyrinomonadaceae bacterium]